MDFFSAFLIKTRSNITAGSSGFISSSGLSMWMFSLFPCRFSPDTPVAWFGGEQNMEGRAPAHCCQAAWPHSPPLLLRFCSSSFSSQHVGSSLLISLCKHMCSGTRSCARWALITLKVKKKKFCLTAQFIQITWYNSFLACLQVFFLTTGIFSRFYFHYSWIWSNLCLSIWHSQEQICHIYHIVNIVCRLITFITVL